MKSSALSAKSVPAPPKQLASFIAKFDPKVAELIRACRAEVRKLLPTANQLVYDNYNFFVIGYSSTERASDCIVSIAAAAIGRRCLIPASFSWVPESKIVSSACRVLSR
jgi:hypothetical protein